MVEALVAGFFTDFVFEFVNGAGGLDRFDFSAAGADEVVAVLSGLEQGEVGGAFVETEAADDAVLGEALEQTVDGGFVAEAGQALGAAELSQGHGPWIFDQCGEQFFQSFGATKTEGAAAGDGLFERCFRHGLEEFRLGILRFQGRNGRADFFISGGHGGAAARGALDEALHDEERFVDFFEGRGVFATGDRQ